MPTLRSALVFLSVVCLVLAGSIVLLAHVSVQSRGPAAAPSGSAGTTAGRTQTARVRDLLDTLPPGAVVLPLETALPVFPGVARAGDEVDVLGPPGPVGRNLRVLAVSDGATRGEGSAILVAASRDEALRLAQAASVHRLTTVLSTGPAGDPGAPGIPPTPGPRVIRFGHSSPVFPGATPAGGAR